MDTLPHLSGQPGNDTSCPEVAAVISMTITGKMISMRRTDANSSMVAGMLVGWLLAFVLATALCSNLLLAQFMCTLQIGRAHV